MTARATTWAIVSVNAAGPVNCARIDVPLVIQYIKSFHFSFHFSFFSHFEGFYGKKCRQPCPSCVNGEFGYRPVSAYYFQLFIVFFFYFFSFKVTDNVIRLTAVVLASRVTWEYDARSLALKVFNYLACLMDRWRHLIYISYTLSALVCQAHMEKDVNRNAIDAKMAQSVITSLVSFHKFTC
jgi:hypothetical protein